MNWEEFSVETDKLSSKVDFTPDIIVGLVRGGLVPARMLSSKLKVKEIYCLTIKKIGNERKVTNEILDDLVNKKILLIEDMLETGKSLQVAKEYLESKGASVKTACLYTMSISEIKPDFYIKELSEVTKFPWE